MSKRPEMLASVIRNMVTPFLISCPPECGVVSLTEVEVSEDFSYATIYVSSMKHPEKALEYFENNQRRIQKNMGELSRKRIPKVRFRIDPRTERGTRIDELLETLE